MWKLPHTRTTQAPKRRSESSKLIKNQPECRMTNIDPIEDRMNI